MTRYPANQPSCCRCPGTSPSRPSWCPSSEYAGFFEFYAGQVLPRLREA